MPNSGNQDRDRTDEVITIVPRKYRLLYFIDSEENKNYGKFELQEYGCLDPNYPDEIDWIEDEPNWTCPKSTWDLWANNENMLPSVNIFRNRKRFS